MEVCEVPSVEFRAFFVGAFYFCIFVCRGGTSKYGIRGPNFHSVGLGPMYFVRTTVLAGGLAGRLCSRWVVWCGKCRYLVAGTFWVRHESCRRRGDVGGV